VDWTKLLETALGASPAALVLGYVAKTLWEKLQAQEVARVAAEATHDAQLAKKDQQIADLQQARLEDLRKLLKP